MANGIELATAYVSLTVDGSKVDSGVRKSLSGVDAQADKVGRSAGKRMGSGMSAGILGAAGRIAGPLAAIFAGIQVGKFLGDSLAEALEAQKVSAATDAIIKSTGGVAKVSAQNVADLSDALSKKLGVDDELIQSGANLILTFKNIRNEAGKGNDVFNRATLAAQDLSAAGFGSISSASKVVGKALNDPVKGMTALTRAGVQFTDAQKELIKGMVQSGDVLGAQKVILAEIESQVGGVAEATATTGEKVGVAWNNIKEQLGTALLPTLERLGNWFLNEGLPALQAFGTYVSEELWPAISEGWATIQPGLERAQQIINDAFGGDSKAGMESFSTFLTDTLIPAIATFVNVWLPVMAGGFAAVGKAAQAAGFLFEAQATVVRTMSTIMINALVGVMNAAAGMLEALSVVPGFGWAGDAAKKLRTVAAKAEDVRDALNNIPRNIPISITAQVSLPGRITLPGGERVNIGLKEHGGPVRAGQPYIVGEKRPELFVPNESGRIIPRVPDAGSGGAAGTDPARDAWLARLFASELANADLAVGVRDVERGLYKRGRANALAAPGR